MDFRQLQLFVAVAEELHFGRAAQRVGMAQPPFSYQIRKLEEELGVALLTRTSRHVALTAAGAQLLRDAYSLLDRRADAEMRVRRAARGEAGTLRIGFGAGAAFGLLPLAVRSFRAQFPNVDVSLHGYDVSDVGAALMTESIDIAFVRTSVQHAGVVSTPLFTDRFVLALPDDHPRAKQKSIALATLATESFIGVPRRFAPEYHDLVIASCRKAGFSPRVVQEAVTWLEVLSCVAAGLGIAVSSRSMTHLHPDRVVFRDIRGIDQPAIMSLAFRSRDESPIVVSFRAIAQAVAQEQARTGDGAIGSKRSLR